MCRKSFMRNIIKMSIIMAFLFIQIQLNRTGIEAKQYSQPFGDIMLEEDEGEFRNIFDARNAENRYETRYVQRQPVAYGDRYQGEHATRTLSRKRGERENNYYNRNNRKLEENNPNGRLISSNIVESQQDNVSEEFVEDGVKHKCNIWVPIEAFDKYLGAKRKQNNNSGGLVYIEICCKGYSAMHWRGQILCRPVCENCPNGRCIAPGVCECYDEYVANDNGDCVFSCPLGCLNGRCYLDGSCQCDPGYKLDKSRKYCRPICSKGCGSNILHNCTEPETCGCIKGYVLTDNDCQPVCQHDCGTGGICREPDNCECNPGFNLKGGVCQADCYQKCDNGICFSRNRCICNPGFTYHEHSTQCIPK